MPSPKQTRARSSAESSRRALLIVFTVFAVLAVAGLAFPILNYIFGFYLNRTYQLICLFVLVPLVLIGMTRPLFIMASTLWGKRRRAEAERAVTAEAIAGTEIETRPQRQTAQPGEVLRIPIRTVISPKLILNGTLGLLAVLFLLYRSIAAGSLTDIILAGLGCSLFLAAAVNYIRHTYRGARARRNGSSEVILTTAGLTLEKFGTSVPWGDILSLERRPGGQVLCLRCRPGSLAQPKRPMPGAANIRGDEIFISLPWLALPAPDVLAAVERFGGIREIPA